MASNGITFEGQNALLTGVGKGSIGLAIVRSLLAGGARVIITTASSYSRATVDLVDYICDTMQLDLDFVLPFAATPENGRQIDGIDDKSELAHRIMLTNVIRLLIMKPSSCETSRRPRLPTADARASFCGRFAAKESVFKAMAFPRTLQWRSCRALRGTGSKVVIFGKAATRILARPASL
ncbi:unnamed protein product [Tilletia laevis]|nr:unnamed protein product [Tilletia caries]CAD6922264.1 unnamed protein product [Tilletia laevis]CAD6934585.1 unnamed protein product [Tilletia laevis]CAD6980270.1 unnamed protein product [Tilletia controversa]